MRRALAVVAALGLVAAPLTAHAAPRKDRKAEEVWAHPDFARFGVERIAMLPAVSYDDDPAAEKQVEGALAQALRDAGYRWISASSARLLLRDERAGDSLLSAVEATVLEEAQVDSLLAPGLCARLRCRAILTVRVDQWEQRELEWNQSGKPTTTVQLRAALVDSTGTLLWRAAGSETGEGPYQAARANPIGLTGGSLQRKPVTGQGGPPSHLEVVTPLVRRWAAGFPAKPAAAPATEP